MRSALLVVQKRICPLAAMFDNAANKIKQHQDLMGFNPILRDQWGW
jgi:hypothetical protein